MEAVPASAWLVVGYQRKGQIRAACQRRNLQRPAEHADAGKRNYDKRRTATDAREWILCVGMPRIRMLCTAYVPGCHLQRNSSWKWCRCSRIRSQLQESPYLLL